MKVLRLIMSDKKKKKKQAVLDKIRSLVFQDFVANIKNKSRCFFTTIKIFNCHYFVDKLLSRYKYSHLVNLSPCAMSTSVGRNG